MTLYSILERSDDWSRSVGTVASGFILEAINSLAAPQQAALPHVSHAYPLFFSLCACLAAAPAACLLYMCSRPPKNKQE